MSNESTKKNLCEYCRNNYHERCTRVYLPNRKDLCECECTETSHAAQEQELEAEAQSVDEPSEQVCDLDCPFDLLEGHHIKDHPQISFLAESVDEPELLRDYIREFLIDQDAPDLMVAEFDSMLAALNARSRPTVEAAEIRRQVWDDAIGIVRDDWLAAYPLDVFPEPPPPPEECTRDLIAAAMGRHMATLLIKQFEAARDAAPAPSKPED